MIACKNRKGPYFSVCVRMMSLHISRMISLYQKKLEPRPDYPGLVSLWGWGGGGGGKGENLT